MVAFLPTSMASLEPGVLWWELGARQYPVGICTTCFGLLDSPTPFGSGFKYIKNLYQVERAIYFAAITIY